MDDFRELAICLLGSYAKIIREAEEHCDIPVSDHHDNFDMYADEFRKLSKDDTPNMGGVAFLSR